VANDSLHADARAGDAADLEAARDVLRRIFGHADFRGLQAGVIGEILAGRSALAVLPTGGGKSLCYQIPSMLRPGLGLVVSPPALAAAQAYLNRNIIAEHGLSAGEFQRLLLP
jgi:superfamily II DNA helicase RecQ